MTDKVYERKRNKLIPLAEKMANEKEGKVSGTRNHEKWAHAWNQIFITEMDRLAREIGIV